MHAMHSCMHALPAGNVVEWQAPEDLDLGGVEFKAMASGSHTLQSDFVLVLILLAVFYLNI